MTKTEATRFGEIVARLFIVAITLVASVGVGVEFHSWAIGLSVGLGLLSLHGINHKLMKDADE